MMIMMMAYMQLLTWGRKLVNDDEDDDEDGDDDGDDDDDTTIR